MMELALLTAALGFWILFKWSNRRRWSPRGRKNRPIRRLSPRIF